VTEYRKAFYRWVREEEEKKHQREKEKGKEKVLHTAVDMESDDEREQIKENDLMAQIEVTPES